MLLDDTIILRKSRVGGIYNQKQQFINRNGKLVDCEAYATGSSSNTYLDPTDPHIVHILSLKNLEEKRPFTTLKGLHYPSYIEYQDVTLIYPDNNIETGMYIMEPKYNTDTYSFTTINRDIYDYLFDIADGMLNETFQVYFDLFIKRAIKYNKIVPNTIFEALIELLSYLNKTYPTINFIWDAMGCDNLAEDSNGNLILLDVFCIE